MSEALATFADIIVPLSLPKAYTYRIPRDMEDLVKPGMRVSVQFGAKKVYAGLIKTIHSTPPAGYEAKYILSVIDDTPILYPKQLEFWEWLSKYYLANLGDVMNAALPAALKLESETKIFLNPEFDIENTELDDREYLIIEALQLKKELSISDVSVILNLKNILPFLKSLVIKEAIVMEESLEEKYKEKYISCLKISEAFETEEGLHQVFDQLEKKEKQLAIIMAIIQLKHKHTHIPKKLVLQQSGSSDSSINSLIKKGYIETYQYAIDRLKQAEIPLQEFVLNNEQQSAFDSIQEQFLNKDVVLLHGITSSGKTHVYVKMMEEQILAGKQVLMLLPEIALTSQIIQRIRKYFGSKCLAFHSKFSDAERVEIWNKVLKNEVQIIIGARSSLFLPFKDLGLIIVDEEQEASYKQQDPAPRYHAREASIYLSRIMGCKTLLGSATPSFESYYNAQQQKYGLVEMNKRFGDIPEPEILIANMSEESRTKTMVGNYFTSVLHAAIAECLANHEQVILFQNRRGYAPVMECESCRWVPKCINCDISLTYHKYNDSLKCHYCGYTQKVPENCHACGSTFLNLKGFGTEKIEDEIKIIFPEARIARLDHDTAKSKHGHEKIIKDFEDQAADILVGTQMIGKGLDFEKVSLVGIINADQLLYFPDFRAHERAYQLMTQVAGRSGRKHKQGKVIIQTHSPDHHVIQAVIKQDYKGLYESDLNERTKFAYPPLQRIIKISTRHKDHHVSQEAAWQLKTLLHSAFGEHILGPESPYVSKIRNYYIREILIKIDRNNRQLEQMKMFIKQKIQKVLEHPSFKNVYIAVDVDPA
ncbi:MAG: replication restart helicase PriA [Bacteroidia bacterium]